MNNITNDTLQEIEKRFHSENGYIGSWNRQDIYCPQVNAIVNLCLNHFSKREESRRNCQKLLSSQIFNKKLGLFHREQDLEGNVLVPEINSCKNGIFALCLANIGLEDEAKSILRNLKNSPIHIDTLYSREYNPDTKKVNTNTITQSNLWIALANALLNQKVEANAIMNSLKSKKLSPDYGLFSSQDCKDSNHQTKFFTDDQALAILTYVKLNKIKEAEELSKNTIASQLYDQTTGLFNSNFNSEVNETKSTYKNSLMAVALWKIGNLKALKKIQKGLLIHLYDKDKRLFSQTTKDKTKVPDNSMLALVAINLK